MRGGGRVHAFSQCFRVTLNCVEELPDRPVEELNR
jgi:hypothetical protein